MSRMHLAQVNIGRVLGGPDDPRMADFYDNLARVIKRKGKLFHYTGTPNKLTSGRDVPGEVAKRLGRAGFATTMNGDGVLGVKK